MDKSPNLADFCALRSDQNKHQKGRFSDKKSEKRRDFRFSGSVLSFAGDYSGSGASSVTFASFTKPCQPFTSTSYHSPTLSITAR